MDTLNMDKSESNENLLVKYIVLLSKRHNVGPQTEESLSLSPQYLRLFFLQFNNENLKFYLKFELSSLLLNSLFKLKMSDQRLIIWSFWTYSILCFESRFSFLTFSVWSYSLPNRVEGTSMSISNLSGHPQEETSTWIFSQ